MHNASDEKYKGIKKRATRGAKWNYLSFGSTKILSLITLSILARLLPPENFGLAALATLTMDYLSVISDLGFGAALIQRKEKVRDAVSTAFTINILANAILTLAIFLAAPLAATFFHEPQVTPVLRWLSLAFILKSVGSIHNVLLERELDFRKKMMANLGSSIIKAIISISLALAGFGVWSLVIGQLVGAGMTTAILWYIVPWRPSFTWNSTVARELFSYGFSIMGIKTIAAWEDNFDYLIIGRIFNTTALGIYTLAYRLPETLILNTMWALTSVLFPAFSALQDEKESLKKGFLSTVRYVELLVTPICLGMVIAADPLIRLTFGDKWVDAIPILQVISLYTLVMSIGFHAGDVYKAIGRPDILLKLSTLMFPIRLLFLWVGAQYSLTGVAFGHLTAEIISAVINLMVMKRMINVKLIELIFELKAFAGGAILCLLALPVLYLTEGMPSLIRLFATATAGAAGYMGTIWVIERRSVLSALRMLGIYDPTSGVNEAGNLE